MRIIAPLLFACLVPVGAFADNSVTSVDDEPTSRVAATPVSLPVTSARVDPRIPSDVGQYRGSSDPRADAVAADDGPAVREHAPRPAHAVGATATDSDVQAELALHQMKRHERALDACVAAAHRRAPSLAGNITLDFDVSDRKVHSVHVSDDSTHDFTLAACLTETARSFSFSLASARFRWPVSIR